VGGRQYVENNVTYAPNKTFPEGRLYPETVDGFKQPSLAGKWGALRRALSGNTEWDIDIRSCAQSILFDIACHFGFDDQLPLLKAFVDDKDAVFDKFLCDHPKFTYKGEVQSGPNKGMVFVESGKKAAKSLHHAMIFGGRYKMHTDSRSTYLEDLQNEAAFMWGCLDKKFKDSAMWQQWNAECEAKAEKKKKRPFYQGSLTARLFQCIESTCIVAAILWFRETYGDDAHPRIYTFDGFTAELTGCFLEKSPRVAALKAMSEHVRQKIGCPSVTFLEKPNRPTEEDKRVLTARVPKAVDDDLLQLLVPAWAEYFFNKAHGVYHHRAAARTVWDALQAAGMHLAMTAGSKGDVYLFKTHRWEPLDETTDHTVLCELILRSLQTCFDRNTAQYNKKLERLQRKVDFAENKDARMAAKSELRRFRQENAEKGRLAHHVQDNGWKQSMAKELRAVIKAEVGSVQFNTKRHMFGLPNGVYDLHTNQLRAGRPEDYSTMCAGVEYVPWDDLPEAEKVRFRALWNDMFDDPEVTEDFSAVVASSLYGMCTCCRLNVLFGRGNIRTARRSSSCFTCTWVACTPASCRPQC